MSSEGGGKLRPKRSHAAPPKPYERKKSLFGKVAETVKDIFSPSWLSDLVANINRTPGKEEEEEAENEDQTKDPHETGLVSADNARPSTSSRAYDYELLRIRSNGQPRSQDFSSQAVSSPLPPIGVSPFTPYTEFTSAQLPLTRLPEKSDSMLVNDDNQSQRSDISKSTSGCSSMIPHPDKRDYQSEVLQEGDSMSDVSIFASVSVNTSQRPLQLQHPSDKYRRVPEMEKTYAWTPCSSGIQHSKPQAPANRNKPSFNASLFGSPIQVDASLLEQSFESSFYAGKTTYGGAAAHRKARLNNASPYQSYPVKKQIKPKPTNNTFDAVTSSTARRIMEALEKMSSPVNDAKKFPVNEYLQGSFLAQKPNNNRSYSGQSSSRATPGPSGFNSSFTNRRSEVKKGPPLNRIMTPEFAVISKNRQVATPPDVMAKLDARIREENKARTVEANSWRFSCQDTVAVRDLSMGASCGKMKRDKSYHMSSKKLEQNDTQIIPDLKTDFTLPLKELPKFQFTPTISGSRNLDSTLQKETLSPKFTFSSPMKEVQPVEKSDSASSVRSEFKFSSPIKVDGKMNSNPSFNFVSITSSSSTSFSTSGCSFGAAASKPSVASSTEPGFMLTSPLSDTAPRVKEPPKSNAAPYMKQGRNVPEAYKWSTSPLQPATQLKTGRVLDTLGKTAAPYMKQGRNVPEALKRNTSPLQPATQLKTGSVIYKLGKTAAPYMKQGRNVPEAFKWNTSPLQPDIQLKIGSVIYTLPKTAAPYMKQGRNVPEAFKWSTSPLQQATQLKTGHVMDTLGETAVPNMKQGKNVPEDFKWSTSPLQPATQLMTGSVMDILGKTVAPNMEQGNSVLEAFKWSTSPLQPATQLKTISVLDVREETVVPDMKQGNSVHEAIKWNTSPLQPATQLKTISVLDVQEETAAPGMEQGSIVYEALKESTSLFQSVAQLKTVINIRGKIVAPNVKQGNSVLEAFKWSTSPLQPATQLKTISVLDVREETAAPNIKQGNIVYEALKGGTSPFQSAAQLKTGSIMDILGMMGTNPPTNKNIFDDDAAAPNMMQGRNVPESFQWSTSPLQPATQLKIGSVMDFLGKTAAPNMKQESVVYKALKRGISPFQSAAQLKTGSIVDILGKIADPNMKEGRNVPETFKWSTSPFQPATQLKTSSVMDTLAAQNMKQGCSVFETFKWSTSPLQPATQPKTISVMDIQDKTVAPDMKQGWNVPEAIKWSTSPLQPEKTAATDLKQGNFVVEAFKGSTSPFQPAAQLKMGSVMDILGKTDSSSPQPPSNYLFGKFQPTAGSWKCGICLIQNKAEDAKCPACQTPKPMTPSRHTATIEPGFVTTATPLVSITLTGSWKCDTCLIKDKAEVKKCVACGSAKPDNPTESNLGSTSIPAGSWKCDTCLVLNKAEVNKCAACGSAKPVKSTESGFGPTSTPLIILAPAESWRCDTCLIQNKADVNRCAACGSSKPIKSPGSESSGTSPVSYLNAFPPGNWICASCLIQNKADAVKCGKCQSNKPAGKSDGVTKTDNSLSDKFRPAVGSWTCNICLVLNKGTSTKCVSCETEKPPPKTGDNLMNNFKKPLGTWDCEICLVTNKPTAVQCIACDSPRPGEKPKHLVPSVAGFKIAAGAFSQNSGFSLPCVSRNESSAPALFKFGSTSGKSDTTTTVPSGFKFGDSSLSGTSSEIKFKLGDSSTGTKASSASVVDSQVKKVDSGNSDFKFGGQTTTVTAETKSASTTVGGTADNVFGQQQNIRSNNDSHKENSTTEELSFKSSNSNASGNSTIKTGGFEFRFSPSSNSQSNSTSFPSSASTGGFSLNKPTNDSIDSSGQTLSKSERTSGGITTASPFSAQSNVSNSVTVNNLCSQQSSTPSSKAESLPTGGFTFTNPILVEINDASDSNKLAVGNFNFISKSSEESKVDNNKPFVFGATANNASNAVASNKSIFKLQPSSETSKLKRTNSGEESDARQGGKRQAMGFGEGSAVNTAPEVFTTTTPFQFTPTAVSSAGVNASKTSGSTGVFTFGQQNTFTSAQPFLSAGSTTISPFNPTGFSSSSPAAATPTAAPVFNFTGQNNTQNSSVFSFTGQSSTTKSSPFPDFGSVKSTESSTPAFGGTSQFSFTGQKQDTSNNMVTTPYGSTIGPAFGGFGSSGATGTTNPASSPFGGTSGSGNVFIGTGSSNTQFGGNGFGSSTATLPGFGGSSGTSFGGSAPVFGGNSTSPAATPAGFTFNFGSTTQNNPFQFTAKPVDSKPQQQLVTPPSSVFVFGQTQADNKPQQQLVAPPSSVFVFGQTPPNPKPQQPSVAAPNSVFVFGQTQADNKPQQQLMAPPSSVFMFGQTQPNQVPPVPAPLSPGAFNFTSQPVFNFTGSNAPPGFAFSATSSQGENPSSNRKIKKAVRKIRR